MSPPNIICFSIDSLRADYASFVSGQSGTTPFLDSFTEECAVYDCAISTSTWTLPSHASIFTGLYPQEHQMNNEGVSLGHHPTAAELLENKGYTTKSFGHNGWLEQGDILRGFEHHHTPAFGPTPRGLSGIPSRALRNVLFNVFQTESRDAYTIKTAIEHLSKETSPFFYFIHLQGTHYKYHPHRDAYRKFGNLSTYGLVKLWQEQKALYNDRVNKYLAGQSISDDVLAELQNLYRGCIYEADQQFKQIISQLEKQNSISDTIIFLFGDHGEGFGENGIFGHNFSVADPFIRVPLLVYDPTDHLPNGQLSEIVQLNDIYPTILDIGNCEKPTTQSISLFETKSREAAYVHYNAPRSMWQELIDEAKNKPVPDPNHHLDREQRLIWQSPDHRALYYPRTERFDTPPDSHLENELMSHLDRLQELPPSGEGEVSDQVMRNLQDMGYL